MGLAMAGTLVASLSTLPSGAWEIIFAALTAWFTYRVAREYRGRGLRALVSEHHAPHLLHSAAMLYMFLALRTVAPGQATSPAMAGMPATDGQSLRLPTLALAFAFLLCAYVVADLDRVPAHRAFARLHLTAPAPAMALSRRLSLTHRASSHNPTRRRSPRNPASLGNHSSPRTPGNRFSLTSPNAPSALRPPQPRRSPRLPHRHGRHDGGHAQHHDLTSLRVCPAAPRSVPAA